MPSLKEAAAKFLASKRVAVTGVSRNPKSHGSNVVDQRLRDRGPLMFGPTADVGHKLMRLMYAGHVPKQV